MDYDLLRFINDHYAVTGGVSRIKIRSHGHFIQQLKSIGFVGGNLCQVQTDQYGRIHVEDITISSILGCGHLVSNVSQIKGYCKICGRFCCHHPGCLEVCAFSGITVCKKHYKTEKGIVVSTKEQGFFWKLKARMLRKKIDEFAFERKLLEYKGECYKQK